MNQPTTHKVDDLVVIDEIYARPRDRGVVFRVTKVNPVTITVEPVNGGRAARGKHELFVAAPEDAVAPAATTIPYEPPLWCGQVVTVAGKGWTQPVDNHYVVLRESPEGKVKLALLGGDEGRYWNIPRAMLTVIDPARITVAPPSP